MASIVQNRLIGSNDFLCCSPFVDVFHRLGFRPDELVRMEHALDAISDNKCHADDIASAVMQMMPWECTEEAQERRRRGNKGLCVTPIWRQIDRDLRAALNLPA